MKEMYGKKCAIKDKHFINKVEFESNKRET
jgi:hypothetical protein